MSSVELQKVTGLAGVPGQGNFFEINLQVRHDKIVNSTFKCHPCTIANKIGKYLMNAVDGRNTDTILESVKPWHN